MENNSVNYLKLNDIEAYKIAFHLSNFVWNQIMLWDHFPKDTVGRQFVKAADSISANIAEGFGRYSCKDKIRFYRYSMGSVKECLDWNEKCKFRKLFTVEQYEYVYEHLSSLPLKINMLIKFTRSKLKE